MEIQEDPRPKRQFKLKSGVFGLIILAFGVILLLRNMKLMPEEVFHVFFSWEMLLIAIGVINLFDRNKGLGVILIAVGGAFLLPHIFDIQFSFSKLFWPAIIILAGLVLMFGNFTHCRRRRLNQMQSSDDFFEDVAVFGGVEKFISTPHFKGGRVVAVFGGVKLNMLQAQFLSESAEIEIVCLFGGVTLIVPPEWNVKMEVVHVFGGVSDKRNLAPVDHTKTLIIRGVTIFGGGEVKSF